MTYLAIAILLQAVAIIWMHFNIVQVRDETKKELDVLTKECSRIRQDIIEADQRYRWDESPNAASRRLVLKREDNAARKADKERPAQQVQGQEHDWPETPLDAHDTELLRSRQHEVQLQATPDKK